MKKNYFLPLLFLGITALFLNSCSGSDDSEYEPVSPVVLELTQVPYAKLSDYKFFVGEMKNLEPAYRVIPFKPNSELFTDYAKKKRFIWMPGDVRANYVADDKALDFPIGTVLIKNFYYDDVLPEHTRKIIETRLLVKTHEPIAENGTIAADSGWKFYEYIWNDEQTDAFYDPGVSSLQVPISFVQNGVTKTTDYVIPSQEQCNTCHKVNPNQTALGEIKIPLGPKPQNLNFSFDYGGSQQNQLEKWQSVGYLAGGLPGEINSTVDWSDAGKPLELRARSYIDANCAHCHQAGGQCAYVPLRFAFSTTDLNLLGVCMEPLAPISSTYTHIIAKGNFNRSDLGYRISATSGPEVMPQIGRTLKHDEGVALIQQWINSMEGPCE